MRSDVPTVVIATRDRCASLCRTLARLVALPERPPVIVVDNASADATVATVRTRFPSVTVLPLAANRGAVARNVGVARASTRYVAFADDDSWWEPGALSRACARLDAHPQVGLVVARVRLAGDGRTDDVSLKMRRAPLGRPTGLPGPPVMSFPAFAAVLRRSAFLDCGGFSPLLHFAGEEDLLVLQLSARRWRLCYLDELVAWHDPAGGPVTPARWATQERNAALTSWLCRPLPAALADTGRLLRAAPRSAAAAGAVLGLARRLPAALRARQVVPAGVEEAFASARRPAPAVPADSPGPGGSGGDPADRQPFHPTLEVRAQ